MPSRIGRVPSTQIQGVLLEGRQPMITAYFVSIMGYFGVEWPFILGYLGFHEGVGHSVAYYLGLLGVPADRISNSGTLTMVFGYILYSVLQALFIRTK